MMELQVLQVSLDFDCCQCEHPIGVTLKCEGNNLTSGNNGVAAVNIACPTCGSLNQLLFDPSDGTVEDVRPGKPAWHCFEPSLN